MDYRFNNVDRIEYSAYKCAYHSTAQKVAQCPLPENLLVYRHEVSHFIPQGKEHERAWTISEKNGHQSPVVLPDAVRRQEFEGIDCVLESVMVFLVLQQGLNPFQRSEYGLRGTGHEASKELHGEIVRLGKMMNCEATIATECAKHNGNRDGLLNKWRQATTVEVAKTFTAELVQGMVGTHTMEHLPKHHLVHWKSADYVHEGRTPTTNKSTHVIVGCGDVIAAVASLLESHGSHFGVDVTQTAPVKGWAIYTLQQLSMLNRLCKQQDVSQGAETRSFCQIVSCVETALAIKLSIT